MKAIITKGKHRGEVVEVSQWCNDWFAINHVDPKLASKPFSPTSLLFTLAGFEEVKKHRNNGMLFQWFEPMEVLNGLKSVDGELYMMSFRRRRVCQQTTAQQP